MNERRRPPRRGRGPRPKSPDTENGGEDNPYRESPASAEVDTAPVERVAATEAPPEPRVSRETEKPPADNGAASVRESSEVPVVNAPPTPPVA